RPLLSLAAGCEVVHINKIFLLERGELIGRVVFLRELLRRHGVNRFRKIFAVNKFFIVNISDFVKLARLTGNADRTVRFGKDCKGKATSMKDCRANKSLTNLSVHTPLESHKVCSGLKNDFREKTVVFAADEFMDITQSLTGSIASAGHSLLQHKIPTNDVDQENYPLSTNWGGVDPAAPVKPGGDFILDTTEVRRSDDVFQFLIPSEEMQPLCKSQKKEIFNVGQQDIYGPQSSDHKAKDDFMSSEVKGVIPVLEGLGLERLERKSLKSGSKRGGVAETLLLLIPLALSSLCEENSMSSKIPRGTNLPTEAKTVQKTDTNLKNSRENVPRKNVAPKVHKGVSTRYGQQVELKEQNQNLVAANEELQKNLSGKQQRVEELELQLDELQKENVEFQKSLQDCHTLLVSAKIDPGERVGDAVRQKEDERKEVMSVSTELLRELKAFGEIASQQRTHLQEIQATMEDLTKAREIMKQERENFSQEAAEMERALKEAEALLDSSSLTRLNNTERETYRNQDKSNRDGAKKDGRGVGSDGPLPELQRQGQSSLSKQSLQAVFGSVSDHAKKIGFHKKSDLGHFWLQCRHYGFSITSQHTSKTQSAHLWAILSSTLWMWGAILKSKRWWRDLGLRSVSWTRPKAAEHPECWSVPANQSRRLAAQCFNSSVPPVLSCPAACPDWLI
ncbi:hypothetical protein CCH79_00000551, partial [Gambusia affinis]